MGQANSPHLKRLERVLMHENLWVYIVSLCRRKKVHAYALPALIEQKFGFRPSRIMCYIVSYRLKSEGLIEAKEDGRRVYYTATKTGIAQLKLAIEKIKKISSKL